MKPIVFMLALLMGLGGGVIASAECLKPEQQVTAGNSNSNDQPDSETVTFWRYEMVTVTPETDELHPYAVDRHHQAHPANQDRIYHRTVVIQLPESDMINASYEVILNPNPVHQL